MKENELIMEQIVISLKTQKEINCFKKQKD